MGGKKPVTANAVASLPVPVSADTPLLYRGLALVGSDDLYMELDYLINNALVADGSAFADTEAMRTTVNRVYGYLNIALESICGEDAKRAGEVLAAEYLKRFFQLGYSIIFNLKIRAASVSTMDYAANRLLGGLKSKRPLFYRGVDADKIDGYREFRSMADVSVVDNFLSHLGRSKIDE